MILMFFLIIVVILCLSVYYVSTNCRIASGSDAKQRMDEERCMRFILSRLLFGRNQLFQKLHGRLTAALMNVIEKDRDGKQVDFALIKAITECLVRYGTVLL